MSKQEEEGYRPPYQFSVPHRKPLPYINPVIGSREILDSGHRLQSALENLTRTETGANNTLGTLDEHRQRVSGMLPQVEVIPEEAISPEESAFSDPTEQSSFSGKTGILPLEEQPTEIISPQEVTHFKEGDVVTTSGEQFINLLEQTFDISQLDSSHEEYFYPETRRLFPEGEISLGNATQEDIQAMEASQHKRRNQRLRLLKEAKQEESEAFFRRFPQMKEESSEK